MGICYEGKTLLEIVEEKERVFQETGYAYGLEKLELVESDPALFMRFQMRLVAACINSREMAKLISANPMSLIQGELLFLLANPTGDCVSASYGLAAHINCFPYIIENIAKLGFEEDPTFKVGDIFATNDAMYGPPHNADNYTWVPVFYKDELVAWTVGLNHIVDVGGIQPGGLGCCSPNAFTDGFIYPPTRTGQNFKQERWWELHWKRRTRTETFNVLDDKMRASGCVVLHDRILEIIEEFGIDYFRKGLKEIIERERRILVKRIQDMAVPGKYKFLQLTGVNYKGVVGALFAGSNRNWILHKCAELNITPDGTLHADCEGLSSEGDFHCNAYPSCVRMGTALGMWPMFAYTETINSSLMYMTSWNLPPGSMFNPQNPFAATVMGLGEVSSYIFMFLNTLSLSYFSRGFLEECFPQCNSAMGYGVSGKLEDGFLWAGGDMSLLTCCAEGGMPYRDGFPASVNCPNPATDMGEVEQVEFLQPASLNIGRKYIPDLCGHGKYRGGQGIGLLIMVNKPGQLMTSAVFAATNGMGACAMGRCGGYPAANDIVFYAHGTNMRELLAEGKPYPRDFLEINKMYEEGTLKVDKFQLYNSPTPNVPLQDGDLFAMAAGQRGGWGDVLERPDELIEEDVEHGWITKECAETVYGAKIGDDGKVDKEKSSELRKAILDRRKERAIDAKDWWKQEREKVLAKGWEVEEMYAMFQDCLTYDKFRREFTETWQLPEDYSL